MCQFTIYGNIPTTANVIEPPSFDQIKNAILSLSDAAIRQQSHKTFPLLKSDTYLFQQGVNYAGATIKLYKDATDSEYLTILKEGVACVANDVRNAWRVDQHAQINNGSNWPLDAQGNATDGVGEVMQWLSQLKN